MFGKLQKIQQELKAPKGQYNSFGKYNYRSAEDILEAVKPLLASAGCALTIKDEIVYMEGRFYVKATATLYDTKNGVEITHTTALAREEEEKKGQDGSQITGTASSYARKYALNGLFCIDDTKDADTDEYKHQQNKADKKPTKPAAKSNELTYREKVIAKAGEMGIIMTELAEMYELNSTTTEARFKEVLAELEEHYAKHGNGR